MINIRLMLGRQWGGGGAVWQLVQAPRYLIPDGVSGTLH